MESHIKPILSIPLHLDARTVQTVRTWDLEVGFMIHMACGFLGESRAEGESRVEQNRVEQSRIEQSRAQGIEHRE